MADMDDERRDLPTATEQNNFSAPAFLGQILQYYPQPAVKTGSRNTWPFVTIMNVFVYIGMNCVDKTRFADNRQQRSASSLYNIYEKKKSNSEHLLGIYVPCSVHFEETCQTFPYRKVSSTPPPLFCPSCCRQLRLCPASSLSRLPSLCTSKHALCSASRGWKWLSFVSPRDN